MAGWFNINYLSDPNFIKSVNSGGGYKAIGDALMTLGGIYNAERDRKYKKEQDKLKNELENKKLGFEEKKANSKVAYDLAGVDLRKAQALYNEKHGNYYDAKAGIDLFDARSKDAKRKSDMGASWANVNINQQKANDLRDYQQGRLAISGGGSGKNGGGWKQKYPLNPDLNKALKIDSLLDTDLD